MGSEIPVLKPDVPMALPIEPQPKADDLSVKLYNEARNAAVKISTDRAKTSSGFIVDDGAHIVTSARNLIGTKEQFATGPDGKKYKLEMEKLDDLNDLAVLKIKNGSIPGTRPLPLGDTESLNPDDRLAALSFPQNADSTTPYLSTGYVRNLTQPLMLLGSVNRMALKQLHDKLEDMDEEDAEEAAFYLQKPALDMKLHIEQGSAGAPVLQKDGKVVAMTTMSNGMDLRTGQTIGAPVEDIKEILEGKGRFGFTYKDVGADWAERFKSDWQNNKVTAAVETGLVAGAGALAYRVATRMPFAASAGIGTYGIVKLSSDVNHLLQSTDTADTMKYGLSAVSDLGTISGAALALAPKFRGYGLALAGLGLAGRAATDFIQNHHVVEESHRLEGEGDPKKPPFSLDELLNTKK